jgi:hypothetical protein
MPEKETTESKEGKAAKDLGGTNDQTTVTVTVTPSSSPPARSTDGTTNPTKVTVTVEVQYPGHP